MSQRKKRHLMLIRTEADRKYVEALAAMRSAAGMFHGAEDYSNQLREQRRLERAARLESLERRNGQTDST